jgi:predicted transcriptional regulator
MEGSALVGVVSARDVVGRRGAGGDRSIADVMTRRVVTIDAHAQLQRAANVMRGRSIGCLVVTEDDRVTGIITVSDLLDLVGRRGTRPATPAARASTHYRVPHRKQRRAGGAW